MGVPVPPATGVVGWAAFDPCVILGDVAAASSTTTTTAISKTTNGREVRVALRFAAPPAASYVHLDTDDRTYCRDHEPIVVAADGDLLLIKMSVNDADDGAPPLPWRFPETFLVCKADPERPWLDGLPFLGHRECVCNQTGIVRSEEGGFFVADLLPRAVDDLVVVSGAGGRPGTGEAAEAAFVAELFRYSSATRQWDLKRLAMLAELVGDPRDWEADAVLPFGGLMCWADYHHGILLCDVAADDPAELRFVRFPEIEIRDDFVNGRSAPEECRTAAVCHGRLWFVDVDDGRFRTASTFPATCTVTTWTLSSPESSEWVKEHTLCLADLWSDWRYRRSPLPRYAAPRFPIVDMQRDDVLHFLVRESIEATVDWTITVDMKNRCLMAYVPYQNDGEVIETNDDVDVSNMFWELPLVCCKYDT